MQTCGSENKRTMGKKIEQKKIQIALNNVQLIKINNPILRLPKKLYG